MRECLYAMPRVKDDRCYVCGRHIPRHAKCYVLFNYQTKEMTLYTYFAHCRCAKEAGLLTHRNNPMFSDAQVIRFWRNWAKKVMGKEPYKIKILARAA